MPGAVSKLLSYSELQNKYHWFRENLRRVFSLLIIFTVFSTLFFPGEYGFNITKHHMILGVPDVSPFAVPTSGRLKFWRNHGFPLEEPAGFSSWRSSTDLGKATDSEWIKRKGAGSKV